MEGLSCEKGRQQRQKKGRETETEIKEVDEQIDSLLFYLDLKTFIRKFKKICDNKNETFILVSNMLVDNISSQPPQLFLKVE